jgi:putative aldouronate transport system substrate-binding protein
VVGAWWYNIIAVNQWAGANPGKNYLDCVHIIAAMSGKPGGKRVHTPNFESSGTVFPYNISDEKLDRLLALGDYLLSNEGMTLCNWGFEGIDYTVNPDGSYNPLHTKDIKEIYPSATIQTYITWNFDYEQFEMAAIPKAVHEYTTKWQDEANLYQANASVNSLASMISTPEKRAFVFDHNKYLTEIITGRGDVTAMYKAMVQDAYTNGVQKVIDSVNKAIGK